MWDFAGEAVPDHLLADLDRVAADPPPSLAPLLDGEEIEELCGRARRIVERPVFPHPGADHHAYPWPLV
jgi:hypothetical protein